jgi:hypothetical protein
MKTITAKELEVLIPVVIDNMEAPTKEGVLKEIKLIDDLLTLQKSRMLFMPKRTKSGKLRADRTLKQVIIARIAAEK